MMLLMHLRAVGKQFFPGLDGPESAVLSVTSRRSVRSDLRMVPRVLDLASDL